MRQFSVICVYLGLLFMQKAFEKKKVFSSLIDFLMQKVSKT